MKRINLILSILVAILIAGCGGTTTVTTPSPSPPSPTPDNIPPTPPTNLTAIAVSANTVELSWSPSIDYGGSGLAGYVVERATSSNGPFIPIAWTSSTTYKDTNLSPNTTYYYRVRAYDNGGNYSSYSNIASATTSSIPDTSPPSIKNTQVNPPRLDFKGGDIIISAEVDDPSGVSEVWARLRKPDGSEENIPMILTNNYCQAKVTAQPNLRTDGKEETYFVWIFAKDKNGNETPSPGVPPEGLTFSVLASLAPPNPPYSP
jgi:hypothetical protein